MAADSGSSGAADDAADAAEEKAATARAAAAKRKAAQAQQKAAEQKAAEEKAAEQKAAEQRAAEAAAAQQAADQKAAERAKKAAAAKRAAARKKAAQEAASPDHIFLSKVASADLSSQFTDEELIALGQGVCRVFDQGASATTVIYAIQSQGVTESAAVTVISQALNVYCPENWTNVTSGSGAGQDTEPNPQFNLGDIDVPTQYEVRKGLS